MSYLLNDVKTSAILLQTAITLSAEKVILALNQIFHYTHCTMLKRVMSLWGPSPRHCARTTQPLLNKGRRDGKPLATLCPI